MTAQQVLDSLKRARPVCVLCRGESGHFPIVGDGPPRCYACIVRLVGLSTVPRTPKRVSATFYERPPWSADRHPHHLPIPGCPRCPS